MNSKVLNCRLFIKYIMLKRVFMYLCFFAFILLRGYMYGNMIETVGDFIYYTFFYTGDMRSAMFYLNVGLLVFWNAFLYVGTLESIVKRINKCAALVFVRKKRRDEVFGNILAKSLMEHIITVGIISIEISAAGKIYGLEWDAFVAESLFLSAYIISYLVAVNFLGLFFDERYIFMGIMLVFVGVNAMWTDRVFYSSIKNAMSFSVVYACVLLALYYTVKIKLTEREVINGKDGF